MMQEAIQLPELLLKIKALREAGLGPNMWPSAS
jgi:hypothetical protein